MIGNVVKGRMMRFEPLKVFHKKQKKVTDIGKFIQLMQMHPALQIVIHDADKETIRQLYRDSFKNDPPMMGLLKEDLQGDDSRLSMCQQFLSSQDCLKQDIHDIFGIQNFARAASNTPANLLDIGSVIGEDVAVELWHAMRPALILATKFLLDPWMEPFWVHLLYGVPSMDCNRKPYLARSPLEDDLESARKDFHDLLLVLKDRITFLWLPGKRFGTASQDGFFFHQFRSILREIDPQHRTRGLIDRITDLNHRQAPYQYAGHIAIGSEFLPHLLSSDSPARRSKDCYVRLQVALAITITHELAHAVNRFRFTSWPGTFIRPEHMAYSDVTEKLPIPQEVRQYYNPDGDILSQETFVFKSDKINEVGWSFEHALWGGVSIRFLLTEPEIDTLYARLHEGILSSPWLEVEVKDTWLDALFYKKTWDHFEDHIRQLLEAVNQPTWFCVLRYVGGIQNFDWVTYENGRALKPHEKLNETEGEIDGDVMEWYRGVRKRDVSEAVKSGHFYEKTKVCLSSRAWGFGSKLALIGKDVQRDPPEGMAPWLDFPDAEAAPPN